MTQGPNPGGQRPLDPYDEGAEPRGPVIRDRRRIDPDTGDLRPGAAEAGGVGPAPGDVQEGVPVPGPAKPTVPGPTKPTGPTEPTASATAADLERQVAERTADLQRLQAEYLNYKRRTDRDKQAAKDVGIATVLTDLLPVLDDIGRARDHGELEGGFRAISEALEAAVAKLGLEKFGEAGDPFDPRVHEAMMHSYSDDVTETTCTTILQPGYRFGERVLRPARVAVSEPTAALPAQSEAPPSETVPESGTDSDDS